MASRKGIHNIYIPKCFMAVRNCISIIFLLEVISMVWSNGMNPSSISQQFNLVTSTDEVFWRFRSLYDLEAIRPSL